MDLAELQTFLTVASERSFSRAAVRLHRTQPAVSQAVRRLEEDLNERLFDRTSKGGRLTEAGRILHDYARRLTDLRDEAASAVRELQDFRRGRVAIGANEAAVHILLPIVSRFREEHPEAQVDVRRVPARQVATEVINGTLDFGVLTFHPSERGLSTVTIGADELVLLAVAASRLLALQARLAVRRGAIQPSRRPPEARGGLARWALLGRTRR